MTVGDNMRQVYWNSPSSACVEVSANVSVIQQPNCMSTVCTFSNCVLGHCIRFHTHMVGTDSLKHCRQSHYESHCRGDPEQSRTAFSLPEEPVNGPEQLIGFVF